MWMITRNLLLAFEKGLGYGESPLFPNLCFRVKEGVNALPSDPNYDLFRLAIRVASTRMHPTFAFMDSTFNAPYGDEAGYMGCRTRVMANVNGPAQINGRGNLFFTTMNLPGLAMEKQSWLEHDFFSALDGRIDLIIDQLLERYNIIKNFKKKDLPFAMQYYLGSEGFNNDDTIEPAIKNGTLSMGFIGLAETLILLTGEHHGESTEAQELGKRIVAHMRKRTDEATAKHGLNFTLLATPAEGLSGRFTAIDAKRYGVIPRVTDKSYYTNSFHVPVDYECTISHKIDVEAVYHEYTNAGHISYIELPYPPKDNLDGLEQVILYMAKKNMGYAGVNFPIDHCNGCHYTGVIDTNCPKCGGEDIKRTRRITGYMSDESKFNDAKYDELKARVTHGGKGCLG
jgi:ribonucleoside-triphosphate reductase